MPLVPNHHYLSPELCREILGFFMFNEESHKGGLTRFRHRQNGQLVEIDFGMGLVHEEEFVEAMAAAGVTGDALTTEIDSRRGVTYTHEST